MNLLATFNQENVSDDEVKQFQHKRSTRGIVFDKDNNIALLFTKNKGYYSIPGGAVNDDETYEQGAIRECKEETGCDAEIIRYIGTTLEYRKNNNLLSESWGYILKIVGEKGLLILIGDEDESEKSTVVLWVSVTKAINLIKSLPAPSELYLQNCLDRDLAFLKALDINK
ncbi:MAG: NUDIX hydrolase [Candidatus Saccharibacteria bacterium]